MPPKTTARLRPQEPRRGRPSVHDEAWSKVSVVLMDRQLARLDRLASDIHATSGTVMTRASVIRALLDGVIDNGIDVTNVSSEPELRRRIASRIAPADQRQRR